MINSHHRIAHNFLYLTHLSLCAHVSDGCFYILVSPSQLGNLGLALPSLSGITVTMCEVFGEGRPHLNSLISY